MKDSEIARLWQVSENSVRTIKRSLNLPPNGRVVVSDEDFLEAFNNGYDDTRKLMDYFGMSNTAIYRRVKKLNLKLNRLVKEQLTVDKVLPLLEKGHSISEIGKILGYRPDTVSKVLKQNDLKNNVGGIKRFGNVPGQKEQFLNLYDKYLTDKEIADKLGIKVYLIPDYRRSLNLPARNLSIKPVELTNEEYQVLLGTLLGDASLSKHKSGNIYGSFSHCVEQKEWIFKKYEYLKRICNSPILYQKHDKRLKNPDYEQYYSYIRTFPELKTIFYDHMYNEQGKFLEKDLLYTIEPLGIATWYQDDGSKKPEGGCLICTNCFSLDEIKLIQEVFAEKFNIKETIIQPAQHIFYIKKKDYDNFVNLISPYVVPSMKYKIS